MLIQLVLLGMVLGVVILLGRSTVSAGHMAFRRMFLLLFAIVAMGAIVFPDSLTWAAHLFGVGRGADLLLYVLVVVFIGNLAMQSRRATELGRKITLTTRRLAIAEAELRRLSKSPHNTPRADGES